jgi:hypothetical protein
MSFVGALRLQSYVDPEARLPSSPENDDGGAATDIRLRSNTISTILLLIARHVTFATTSQQSSNS